MLKRIEMFVKIKSKSKLTCELNVYPQTQRIHPLVMSKNVN